MATYTFDPENDAPTEEQQAAEAAALEQGEKLAQIQQEDLEKKYAQQDDENVDPSLIGGKFKSQDDLLKAYNELQKKLGQETPEEGEEPAEEPVEASEEPPAEEVSEAAEVIKKASAAYAEAGDLSEESIEELDKLDSRELIKAYVESYKANQAAAQQASIQQSEVDALMAQAGGADAYQQMVGWAAENFSADEIAAFNQATTNAGSARFAIEALKNRYTAANGSEPRLVTGKQAVPSVQPYRSNAELARDIADPRYSNDPAFRQDVEARLSRSQDLL